MVLSEIVRAFLSISLMEPEKPPKTQRAQRENRAMVIGYNRAQEDLRTLLSVYGAADDDVALASVRDDKQVKPMKGPGGTNLWVM